MPDLSSYSLMQKFPDKNQQRPDHGFIGSQVQVIVGTVDMLTFSTDIAKPIFLDSLLLVGLSGALIYDVEVEFLEGNTRIFPSYSTEQSLYASSALATFNCDAFLGVNGPPVPMPVGRRTNGQVYTVRVNVPLPRTLQACVTFTRIPAIQGSNI